MKSASDRKGPGRDGPFSLVTHLTAAIDRLATSAPLWVAFSGGRDSLALLHAASSLGRRVQAVHIDHALHPESAQWADHCRDIGARLGVAVRVVPVAVEHRGDGVEAAARRARLDAFAVLLDGGGALLTAHHREDQAETVLLQLLRGTGLSGLAGMPATRPLGDGLLVRPLLDVPRAALDSYARTTGFAWLDDPMNDDGSLDRNFLRHRVLPLIATRWPDPATRIARAATHVRDAQRVLHRREDEILRGARGVLSVDVLADYDDRERGFLVRRWLQRQGVRPPGERRLVEGLSALLGAARDRQPEMRWEGGRLRRYADRLYLLPVALSRPIAPAMGRGPTTTSLSDGSRLRFEHRTSGLDERALAAGWEVRPRAGGERIRVGGMTRRVKQLLQQSGLPPWVRSDYPMLWVNARLAAVPGVAVADEFRRHPGWLPVWTEAESGSGDA